MYMVQIFPSREIICEIAGHFSEASAKPLISNAHATQSLKDFLG